MYNVKRISKLTRGAYPERYIVWDCESYRNPIPGGEAHALRLVVGRVYSVSGSGITCDDEVVTSSVGVLGGWLDDRVRGRGLWHAYAHNLAYDIQVSGLIQEMVSRGWRVVEAVTQSPPTWFKLRKGHRTIVLLDSLNILPLSLERLGDMVGLPKLKLPDVNTCPDDELITYCRRDVDALALSIYRYMDVLRRLGSSRLSYTLASQALTLYRSAYMDDDIPLHRHDDVIRLERDAYYGGRVEAYRIGTVEGVELYKLDVNSMYPYVMRNPMPYRLAGHGRDVSVDRLAELMSAGYWIIARVKLRASRPAYPYRMGSKLVFPVGTFDAALHTPEIAIALERGEIERVYEAAIYEVRSIFRGYVDALYPLKCQSDENGDKATRMVVKLLLNSLYGKFGQRGIETVYEVNQGNPHWGRLIGYSERLGSRVETIYMGDVVLHVSREGESAYSQPSIAGAVTSYARAYLYRLIEQAGRDNVYYVDTDSLIVNSEGYARLSDYIDPAALGALKLEGVSNGMTIKGAKDYTFDGESKHKGIPTKARELSPGVYEYDEWRGLITWLNLGMPVGMEIRTRCKARRVVYDKGVVLSDGSVAPLALGGS